MKNIINYCFVITIFYVVNVCAMDIIQDSNEHKEFFKLLRKDCNVQKIQEKIHNQPSLITMYTEGEGFAEKVAAIHIAAAHGNCKILKTLFKNNVDVNMKSEKGNIPLHYAYDKKTARLLHKKGADINAKDVHGNTVFENLLLEDNVSYIQYFLLHKRPMINRLTIAQFLLRKGVDINKNNHILHSAVRYNLPEVLDWLLAHGANPYYCDGDVTAFAKVAGTKAADNRYDDLLQVFEKYGMLFIPSETTKYNNPFLLLMNNAYDLKELQETYRLGYRASFNVIARLFAVVQYPNSPFYHKNQMHGILCNDKGWYSIHSTEKDMQVFFGTNAIEYAQKCINDIYTEALKSLCHDSNHFTCLMRKHPFCLQWAYNHEKISQWITTCINCTSPDESQHALRSLECILKALKYEDLKNCTYLLERAIDVDNDKALLLLIKHNINYLAPTTYTMLTVNSLYHLSFVFSSLKCKTMLDGIIACDLLRAMRENNKKRFKKLLAQKSNVNWTFDDKDTLLHKCIQYKDSMDYMKLLIEAGADVNIKRKDNVSPLYHVILCGDKKYEKCQLLLKAGASITSKMFNDFSPLSFALWKNKVDIVRLFLEHNPHVIIDKDAMEIALKSDSRTEILSLLLEHKNLELTEEMIQAVKDEKIKEQLQQIYESRKCIICFEHAELNIIPCNNTHTEFLCQNCYHDIKKNNNCCPLCRGELT